MTGTRTFALQLDLGPVPASLDDVLREVGSRLDDFQPRFVRRTAELEVSLTVRAQDLWLAVLMAMAALTSLGYPVRRLDARPVPRSSGRSGVSPRS